MILILMQIIYENEFRYNKKLLYNFYNRINWTVAAINSVFPFRVSSQTMWIDVDIEVNKNNIEI